MHSFSLSGSHQSKTDLPVPEVRYWQQFQQALDRHLANGDIQALRQVNRKLVEALVKRGQPRNDAEAQARSQLAKRHQQIIDQLQSDKDRLAANLRDFRCQQDGLAAYELTALSSGLGATQSTSVDTTENHGY